MIGVLRESAVSRRGRSRDGAIDSVGGGTGRLAADGGEAPLVSANPEDWALTRRMLAGEEAAFDEFFKQVFPGLYRFALSRLRFDEDGAEDVTQATLCAAIAKLHTYRGESPLFTWLCTFCRHELSAFWRRNGRIRATVEELTGMAEFRPLGAASVTGDDPEAELARREAAASVHALLDELPADWARALEWKYIEGLPVTGIAARLGLSPKAAESLLTRARQGFRDRCQDGEGTKR